MSLAAAEAAYAAALKAADLAAKAETNPANFDAAMTAKANAYAAATLTFVKAGDVVFTSGEITGACPAGGGPLGAGAGTGGEIT